MQHHLRFVVAKRDDIAIVVFDLEEVFDPKPAIGFESL
jgi:hypothetical protein